MDLSATATTTHRITPPAFNLPGFSLEIETATTTDGQVTLQVVRYVREQCIVLADVPAFRMKTFVWGHGGYSSDPLCVVQIGPQGLDHGHGDFGPGVCIRSIPRRNGSKVSLLTLIGETENRAITAYQAAVEIGI